MPIAKAHVAGATPKDTYDFYQQGQLASHLAYRTYEISKRVQFLPHETALLPPPSHFAIEEVKEKTERHESQCHPET